MVLVTDAFGGRGGIAKFNRDFLSALCSFPEITKVTAFVRIIKDEGYRLPEKLEYITRAANSKLRFLTQLITFLIKKEKPGIIFLGHVNFLPLLPVLRIFSGKAQFFLIVHGIEAWHEPRNPVKRILVRKIDGIISVSQFTKEKFLRWSGFSGSVFILPNCVDLKVFMPGSKRGDLMDRYGLRNKRIIMTVARLEVSEQYKGIDEVMEVLPELAKDIPEIAYLIVGDGNDLERLRQRARQLGVEDHVVFSGYLPEQEKPDHYRLADAYVMPSSGEGFGITYLEALACGLPVLGGMSGAASDLMSIFPNFRAREELFQDKLKSDILELLLNPPAPDLEKVKLFSFSMFSKSVHSLVARLISERMLIS